MRNYFIPILILAAFGWMLPALQAQVPCEAAPVITSGPGMVCTGSTSTYTLAQDPGIISYLWMLDGIEISYSPDSMLDIQWTEPGTYHLCVEANCPGGQTSPQACMLIEVYEIDVVNPEPRLVCAPDTFGANAPGVYLINLPTADGCDSVITLVVALYPEGPADLGTFHLCPGDSWTLNGETYIDSGDYVVYDNLPFPPYCFQEIHFSIRPLSAADYQLTAIPPKTPKGTASLSVKPMMAGNTPTYIWNGPNGFGKQGMTIHPPVSGLYCVDIIQPFQSDPFHSCQFTLCHLVDIPLPPDTDKGPTGNDNGGQTGLKAWLYPVPAKDYICIEWPNANLEGSQFLLFNRWGAEVQSGTFSGSCVNLVELPADIYALLIILADGSMLKSWMTIQQ